MGACIQLHLKGHLVRSLVDMVTSMGQDVPTMGAVALEFQCVVGGKVKAVAFQVPRIDIIDTYLLYEIGHHLVLDGDINFPDCKHDFESGLSEDIDVVVPHRVNPVTGHRCYYRFSGGSGDGSAVSSDEPSGRKLHSDIVKRHRSGVVVKGHSPADMQRTSGLEYLSGKRTQTQFERISGGRLLIDIIEPLHNDIYLP